MEKGGGEEAIQHLAEEATSESGQGAGQGPPKTIGAHWEHFADTHKIHGPARNVILTSEIRRLHSKSRSIKLWRFFDNQHLFGGEGVCDCMSYW